MRECMLNFVFRLLVFRAYSTYFKCCIRMKLLVITWSVRFFHASPKFRWTFFLSPVGFIRFDFWTEILITVSSARHCNLCRLRSQSVRSRCVCCENWIYSLSPAHTHNGNHWGHFSYFISVYRVFVWMLLLCTFASV